MFCYFIEFQGKGDMLTWWLHGLDPAYQEPAPGTDGSKQGSQVIAVQESQTKQDNA